jgi:predicted transposase YbfD/YdcC
VILRPVAPSAIDFAFARTIVAVQNQRTEKRSGLTSCETRYYLSSQDAHERTPEGWIELIRGHWGGIENRNHWRRDALCGEDRTRSRKPRMVANLALLRSATFRLLSRHHPEQSLPEMQERFARHSAGALALLRSKS